MTKLCDLRGLDFWLEYGFRTFTLCNTTKSLRSYDFWRSYGGACRQFGNDKNVRNIIDQMGESRVEFHYRQCTSSSLVFWHNLFVIRKMLEKQYMSLFADGKWKNYIFCLQVDKRMHVTPFHWLLKSVFILFSLRASI